MAQIQTRGCFGAVAFGAAARVGLCPDLLDPGCFRSSLAQVTLLLSPPQGQRSKAGLKEKGFYTSCRLHRVPPRSFDRVYSKHINALKGGGNSDKRVCERLRLFGFLWSLTLSTPHKQPQSNILCQYKLICNLYPNTVGLALHVSSVTVFLCFCGSLVCTITATPMKNRECDVLPRTRCH